MLASLVWPCICAVGCLPLGLRRWLGRRVGTLYSIFPTRERQIAQLQLQRFLPEHANSTTIRNMFEGLGQTVLEGFNLTPFFNDENSRVDLDPEFVKLMQGQGKGVLALTAHTGNWDLLAAAVIRSGVRLSTVARELRSPFGHEIVRRLREAYGVEMIFRADRSGARQILKHWKKNLAVGSLIDQDTRVRSCWVPFFGKPAKSPVGIIELAKRAGADICAVFLFRTSGSSYQARFRALDSSCTAEQIAAEYNSFLEECLREFPEQWVWFHKRWRSLPDGEQLSSSDYLQDLRNEIQSA